MLLSLYASLEGRKRRGQRGINISSGSGAGDFEGLIRIEVDQEDSYLCRWWRSACNTPHVHPDPDHKPLHRPVLRGGSNVYSDPGTLSDGRLEMNRKRPTAYVWQWGVVFRKGNGLHQSPPCFTVYSSGRWMSGLPSPPSLGGWGCSGLSGFLGSFG